MEAEPKTCCTPSRAGNRASLGTDQPPGVVQHPQPTANVPGGRALVGTHAPLIADDGEGPTRTKRVAPFRITTTTITNATFARFIAETGYMTDAERLEWSFVFHSDVPKSIAETQAVVSTEWWRKVDGATWANIHGSDTAAATLPDHPVVQVSWNDALSFAAWCGGRLPSEAEWEHAARGGLGDVRYPWGDNDPDDDTFQPCNIWQGRFPTLNTAADGWRHTAPAQSFEPNGYGLYNMVGNVWEWTAEPFRVKSLKKSALQRRDALRGLKLLKGGSYLCHRSYCFRYRIAARTSNTADTTTPHTGFRVVWNAK